MKFADLGLMPRIIDQLSAQGITDPTPIQQQAIPHALEGRDVMGLAQTGTGKTAAFGLPIMQHLLTVGVKPNPKTARGLILAPTRELAGQIKENLDNYSRGSHIKTTLVVGGMSIKSQINKLDRGTDLLVATPGRLIDLIDRGAIDLSETQFLVLDEADQMLDLGFIHALRRIAPLLADKRQTMLFSATMPKQMAELANAYLKNPEKVAVSKPGQVADKITQEVHFVAGQVKTELLIELLGAHKDEATIIFCRTKHGSERLMKALAKNGFATDSVHGNKSQGQRQRAIDALKSGKIKILVATDVAARGLDIPVVRFVYNYDLPNVPENYVHRIGRTARAGKDGKAIALVASDEMGVLKDVEKVLKGEIPVASGRRWDTGYGDAPKGKGRPNRKRGPQGPKGAGDFETSGKGFRPKRENGGGGKPGGKPKGKPDHARAWDPVNDSPSLDAPKGKPKKPRGDGAKSEDGGKPFKGRGKPSGGGGRNFGKPGGGRPGGGGKPKGRGGKPISGGNATPRRSS